MIQDLDKLAPSSILKPDLCIVGSGAVGLALAQEFLNSNLNVLILESGSFDDEPRTQQLYEVDSTGLPFVGAILGRFRTFGGSTTRWGGQALPLTPIDFEARPWVPHSGWPLEFDSLRPYYDRAAKFLRVDPLNFDTDIFPLVKTAPPAFDPAIVRYHYTKWSPNPNLREVYGQRIKAAPKLTVLFHANLLDIRLNDSLAEISLLHVRSLGGNTAVVQPRCTVLALGGLETARLLLASNSQIPAGVGNQSGRLGRFFQDHPGIAAGDIYPKDPRQFRRLFSVALHRKLKYAVRLSAAATFQEQRKILNATAVILFNLDPNSPVIAAKNAFKLLKSRKITGELCANLARAALHAPTLFTPIYHLLVKKRIYTPGNSFQLGLTVEQNPDVDSYLELSEQRDALGIPKLRLHWNLSPLVRKTFSDYSTALQAEFERLNLARIELFPWITDPDLPWLQAVCDQSHHMGTARMSADPAQGVVDPNCFLHQVPNCAIASSAVFPTSGHSNPTFTLLALTLRLADELKRRLQV